MDHVPKEEVETVEAAPGVHLSQLAAGERTSVQGFYIEPGASVPQHSHPHEQAGHVASGTLTFLVGDGELSVDGDPVAGEEVVVAPGEAYVIPGDEPHGAVNRGEVPVEGVDVFSPPRLDPDWADE